MVNRSELGLFAKRVCTCKQVWNTRLDIIAHIVRNIMKPKCVGGCSSSKIAVMELFKWLRVQDKCSFFLFRNVRQCVRLR